MGRECDEEPERWNFWSLILADDWHLKRRIKTTSDTNYSTNIFN